MATILLQSAGAFLGSFFGPVGSAIGSTVGAMAGYAIDNAVIQSTRRYEGPRMTGMRPFQAEEGAVLPQVFGAARVSGTMIWATRFEERRTTRRQGLKGGPKVTEYSYFANVAFALCDGPVAGVRRVWADGRELDLARVEMRLFNGTQDQLPDPLIEAKQGAGNAPAYRGTAYVVFERLALDGYGNRVPQMQFEVLAPAGDFHQRIQAVALIPGATEYGLSPARVIRDIRPGERETLNRHVLHGDSDFTASIDELQALCPGLRHVALVVPWFADDLRAGHCRIEPGVTERTLPGVRRTWSVAGIDRGQARLVSRAGGRAAYGGTPDDRSVTDAIRDLAARGLKVAFYPFLLMDIPPGNGLPDPWGGDGQAPFPWRGRVTGSAAPGKPGSPDGSAAVRAELAEFLGRGEGPDSVRLAGSPDWPDAANEAGYRRMILHYARLCAEAGGVDAFLLGSELRGLTSLRDDAGVFPFVHGLRELAREVRAILGAGTKITYGADWSEYFGHQPADGSGDVCWHLDDLWMDEAIDAVGIDNYMPLSDWRDSDLDGANPDGAQSPQDGQAMREAITAGEGHDWHYADVAARSARIRSRITDGAHGKPWVYRYKDLANWWLNEHVERRGGVETGIRSAWVPGAKPVWFTELGCPAIDKGANQPNVFLDAKSSESQVPHFSSGGRDDLVQRRFLEAHFGHWSVGPQANPLSPVTGKPMVDTGRLYCWAWDTRPFPAFPQDGGVWADGVNWARGHWLNGRVEAVWIGDVINAVLARHGLPAADVEAVDAMAAGILIDNSASAREALEPLVAMHGLSVSERDGRLVFASQTRAMAPRIVADVIEADREASVEADRAAREDVPAVAVLAWRDPFRGYEGAVTRFPEEASGGTEINMAYPGILNEGAARSLAAAWLARIRQGREECRFALPPASGLSVGQRLAFADRPDRIWLVTEVEAGMTDMVRARRIIPAPPVPDIAGVAASANPRAATPAAPRIVLIDLPMADIFSSESDAFCAAAWSRPWRTHLLEASPEDAGYGLRATLDRPAAIGSLVTPLAPGLGAVRERAAFIEVGFPDAELESVSDLQLFAGANTVAIQVEGGSWEVLQYQDAEEIRPAVWRLSRLIRGQAGTEDLMRAGAPVGATAVLLDDSVKPAGLRAGEAGLELSWRARALVGFGTSADATIITGAGGLRARMPLSPVHLRAMRMEDGGVRFSWIRRSRLRADGWDEVPLGEERESYRVVLTDGTGVPQAQADVGEPAFLWPAGSVSNALSAGMAQISLGVRQAGGLTGHGLPATATFALPSLIPQA
ncbi:glycoside hydrolase TIM-barrel-like domain-containing protein [Zhengella sp. ZM62]|uniref:baseplate multidomain protein megatron n=1 Tax=Zhengella sedimenti TaxID=3390035 RepID=UPI0039763C6D